MVERKRKKVEEARRKHEKEMEIARRVRARENRSNVESELESEDPTEVGDDVIFSEEEDREVVVTSMESPDLSTPRRFPNWYAPLPLLRVLFPFNLLFFDFESPVP